MARPFWRGQLRLALVTCPINLTPATTERDKIRFHKLNRETGNRLRMQMIDSETQDVVERDETVMGYEFEKGKYVTVENEELDKLKIESSDVIDIERVVPIEEVDWLYWEKPYLLEPDARGKGAKSTVDIFATIREALKGKKIVFAEEPERDSNVVDITEALKASLRGTSKAANTNSRRSSPKRRPAARSKSTRKRGKHAA